MFTVEVVFRDQGSRRLVYKETAKTFAAAAKAAKVFYTEFIPIQLGDDCWFVLRPENVEGVFIKRKGGPVSTEGRNRTDSDNLNIVRGGEEE